MTITKTYGEVYEARRYPCAIMHNGTKDEMPDYEDIDRMGQLEAHVRLVRARKNVKYNRSRWRWAQGSFWPLSKRRPGWL